MSGLMTATAGYLSLLHDREQQRHPELAVTSPS